MDSKPGRRSSPRACFLFTAGGVFDLCCAQQSLYWRSRGAMASEAGAYQNPKQAFFRIAGPRASGQAYLTFVWRVFSKVTLNP
jgi:hypothetical protein